MPLIQEMINTNFIDKGKILDEQLKLNSELFDAS
jgi:hypothetical protein